MESLQTQECVLLFDGLDKVLSNQMRTAKKILQAAVELRSAKVFVATRLHLRDELENTLHVLSYTMQPFDEFNQIVFLIKFWKMRGAILNESLIKFTSECVKQLRVKVTDSEGNIAGIPLQCRLLAEIYEKHVIRECQLEEKDYSCDSSVVMTNSMFELYKRYMDLRFAKFVKQGSLLKRLLSFIKRRNRYETIKQVHMYFALKLLFPEHAAKFQHLNHSYFPLHELCAVGILEATHSDNIRFVHRSLAEFLVAWLVHENIIENKSEHQHVHESIFQLAPQNVDLFVPFVNSIELESFKFNFPVICYFLNGFAKDHTLNQPATDYHEEALPFYIASAYHNYEDIPNIVTHRYNIIPNENSYFRNLLYIIAHYSSLGMMNAITTKSKIDITQIYFMCMEEYVSLDAFKITLLHVAVERGDYRLVEYLLSEFKEQASQLRYLIHFCVVGSAFDSTFVVKDKVEIMKRLSDINIEWIDEQILDQTTPLTQYCIHTDLLECLIYKGAKLSTFDKDGNTVLHRITERNKWTGESYHQFVNALNKHGFQHFNKSNKHHITPLHMAICAVKLLSSTLTLFTSNGANLNAVDEHGDSVLFYAIREKSSIELIKKMIKHDAETEHHNQKEENILHISVQQRNLKAMEYFIDDDNIDNMNVNEQDVNGNTPLHLAVLQSRRFKETEPMQQLLINTDANVNAMNNLNRTPFLDGFQRGDGLSLTIIKEMENNGLNITKAVASSALTTAFLRLETISHASAPLDVLEYLIYKGGSVDFDLAGNFWKWEKVKKAMPVIIQHTVITLSLLTKAKELGLLTEPEFIKLQNLHDSCKSEEFIKMVQDKPTSFERVYIILRSDQQTRAVEELRNCLRNK